MRAVSAAALLRENDHLPPLVEDACSNAADVDAGFERATLLVATAPGHGVLPGREVAIHQGRDAAALCVEHLKADVRRRRQGEPNGGQVDEGVGLVLFPSAATQNSWAPVASCR